MRSSQHALDGILVRNSMNVDQILSQLQHIEGHFANDAVLEAVALREEMIPALLSVIRDVAEVWSYPNCFGRRDRHCRLQPMIDRGWWAIERVLESRCGIDCTVYMIELMSKHCCFRPPSACQFWQAPAAGEGGTS